MIGDVERKKVELVGGEFFVGALVFAVFVYLLEGYSFGIIFINDFF